METLTHSYTAILLEVVNKIFNENKENYENYKSCFLNSSEEIHFKTLLSNFVYYYCGA